MVPNVSAGCDFPDEVLFELFINTDTDSLKYVHDNFSAAITEVTMTNIEITERLIFSFINISSIYGFTIVRVSQFAEVVSLMNECFDMSQTNIIIGTEQYNLTAKLTDACIAEVLSSEEY